MCFLHCEHSQHEERREKKHLTTNGLNDKCAQTTGSATSHSLSEAFPLQEVLHSSVQDSAANYFFNHKLLDKCRLLSLPLFGSLLLSHSAVRIEEKQIVEGQGIHKNKNKGGYFVSLFVCLLITTMESGKATFISLLLGFCSTTWQWRLLCCALQTKIRTLIIALHLPFPSGDGASLVQNATC